MSPYMRGMEVPGPDVPHDTMHVYRDSKKEWRWKRVAPNGKIIAHSGESYKRKSKCLHGLSRATDPNYRVTIEGEPS